MSRQEDGAEDSMQRLVRAMMGHDHGPATSLARRVLTSQIGAGSHDSDRKHIDLSSTWRRISRKATDPKCRSEIEPLYAQLEQKCEQNVESELPPKLLAVLTKLMGKKIRPAAPFRQPTSSTITFAHPTIHPPSQNSIAQTHALNTGLNEQQQVRQEKQELETEEALLLRECLYSLQGIDGERIRYYHRNNNNPQKNMSISSTSGQHQDAIDSYDGIRVQSPALSHSLLYTGRVVETRLGSGAMDALRISAEAGWLYQRIQSYITQVQQTEAKGVVARAFCGTLTEELRDYHSLLAQYESKLSDLSLRQLFVELRMPTSRLKILALLTDGLRDFTGGHLLSALHKHSLHGDTRHANLVQSIVYSASRPWFDILFLWTTQGVLSDPHQEFFVTEVPGVDDKYLWNDKYRINKDQIPMGILDPELVGPAFNVGKGINFIRRCLLDGQWTMQLQQQHIASNSDDDTTTDGGFNRDAGYRYKPYSNGNATLQRTLTRAAQLVHSHILKTLKEDNHIMQHLFALKQFLFLGQGDFFSALMEGLHSEFNSEAGVAGIYKHSLLAIVEGALRSTNAKYLPQYVLDRLQVELLLDPDDDAYNMFGPDRSKGAKQDRRTVWDIFMLDYQVPDPLIAIVPPSALDKYKMVFSLLFGLKKIEFMLNFTWRQSATLQHALQTYAQYNGIHVGTSKGYTQASFLLRKISILRQSMTHLIVNLKSYLMFEVLEGGWRRLESEVGEATTLDDVIDAHGRYIDGIVRKSLVRTDNDDRTQQHLGDQVQTLLVIAGEFCDLQERVFQDSLLAADIATEKRMEAASRQKQGHWGFDSEQDISEEENFFGLADVGTVREVVRISEIYNENAKELLRVLTEKVNGNPEDFVDNDLNDWEDDPSRYGMPSRRRVVDPVDDDLDPQRFLIAQLDHNNYYGAQAET